MIYNFIIIFLFKIIFCSYKNPSSLTSKYPFSYKKDNSISVIFMENKIAIYNVNKLLDNAEPLEEHDIDECNSGKEKGGIYLNKYYYTSCKIPNTNDFKIKVYNETFHLVKTFPENNNNYTFSSGTIRFFSKKIKPEIIGVVWVNNGEFNMLKLNHTKIKQYRHYPVSNMARDVDCLFITYLNRIVCIFGIIKKGIYACSANIFTYDDDNAEDIYTSNLKTWEVCNNHYSRKIIKDTDNNPDSTIFYYYFVDTNGDAYIIQMKLLDIVTIIIGPVLQITSGCDEDQYSFDMAEDKFMGYNVFICVERRFKKK